MAFRISLPSSDARIYRDEEVTSARLSSSRRTTATSPLPMAVNPTDSSAQDPSTSATAQRSNSAQIPAAGRRHVVFADPVAFRYLEEDACVNVIERRGILRGYELYLVEQWACSRQSPTLVIVTYTGDPNHSVVVGVLGVPDDETSWSPRLRVYFKAIQHYHARPKETPLGELMVTNLSSFPSALTVIPVPDGDIKKHRQAFIVNEDLKRLGCSGRSGMTLSDPAKATQDKFTSLYKTSDRLSLSQSVLELLKMCQLALLIFGKLEQQYIDGLLCDVTEKAINDWWTEIGSEYFNMEPTDGILGPTTVAALLGTLMGARNRLSWYGAPVPKDVFDVEAMKRGIGTFQKAYKLDRSRRLDHQTLRKLHSVSAKAAAGDGGWGVQKKVKSTVEGFGGKKGEIVIGMVGGRDKANMGEIETLDIDKFISIAQGENAKWLWHGKPRKSTMDHHAPDRSMADMGNLLFGKDDKDSSPSTTAETRRTQSMPLADEMDARKRDESPAVYSSPPPGSALSVTDSPGDRDALRKTVFKSVAGKVSDARTGLGRIRDAVGGGLRGHHVSRQSKDEGYVGGVASPSIASLAQTSTGLSSPVMAGRAFTWKNKPEEYANGVRRSYERPNAVLSEAPEESEIPSSDILSKAKTTDLAIEPHDFADKLTSAALVSSPKEELSQQQDYIGSEVSVTDSVTHAAKEVHAAQLLPQQTASRPLLELQRRHSLADLRPEAARPTRDHGYWRRMSFSTAEEAVLGWDELIEISDDLDQLGDATLLAENRCQTELAQRLYTRVRLLKEDLTPWAGHGVDAVTALSDAYDAQQESLQSLYYELVESYRSTKQQSEDVAADERARVTEAVHEIEVLAARLEYEMNALASKVGDIEDGVRHLEGQVVDVEKRADELRATLETESWPHWFVRTLTGIGTGPNITRGAK